MPYEDIDQEPFEDDEDNQGQMPASQTRQFDAYGIPIPQTTIGSPDLMFNDPPSTIGRTPSMPGFVLDSEGYSVYGGGGNEGYGVPVGQGGQNNMATTYDWNAAWNDAGLVGGWGSAIGSGTAGTGASAPAGGTTAPAIGSNLWDVGALLLSGYQAYSAGQAAKKAGQLQYQSTQDASQAVEDKFLIGKAGLDPYSRAGVPAVDRQSAILGLHGPEAQAAAQEAMYAGPGFEFQRDRIIGDITRGASADRQLKSGNRLAALTDRLQGLYASQGAQHFSQLSDVAKTGLAGASAVAGVSQGAGTAISQNIREGGTNLAQAKLGSEEAYQSGIADIYGTARDRWGN